MNRCVCVCLCVSVCACMCMCELKCEKGLKASSAFAVVVNAPCGRPVVALPPSPAPPHGQDGVSVHSGSRERERCCRDSGGGLRHLGRGRQPPLVLKPETTRSGLIYRERRGEGGRDGRQGAQREGGEGKGGGDGGVARNKNIDACQKDKTSCGHA